MGTENHTTIDLERSLAELETLVTELERGDLPLEQSLARFEQGVNLVRRCQTALNQAEQRVEQLSGVRDGEFQSIPFTASNSDESR